MIKFFLFCTLFFSASQIFSQERPIEPWVIRSVLDGHPRLVNVALHKNLYVAYDSKTGGIHKIWDGGINFQGPVFTQKHGPQPTSKGQILTNFENSGYAWKLQDKDGNILELDSFQFKGYYFDNKKVTFEFALFKDKKKIIVQETPEVRFNKTGVIGLERSFEVKTNETNFQPLAIHYASSILNEKKDVVSNSKFIINSKTQYLAKDGKTTSSSMTLLVPITATPITQITTYYASVSSR